MAHRGDVPIPDWARLHYADEPALQGPVPALTVPVEDANLVLNREIITINRAGGSAGNPILAGLGVRMTVGVGSRDRLTGLWLFNDRRELGLNQVQNAPAGAPGFRTFDFLAGSGQTIAGSPAIGAKRNFVRWETAAGTVERSFWIKTPDADIVAIAGTPALNPSTLLAEEVVVQMIDPSRAWLEVNVDFFVSWNDEFQKLHNAANEYLDPGFRKAYGGAAFVSAFDTETETEGVGVEVNPFTDEAIHSKHTIQIENVAGVKAITFRFRSKAGSLYFVDVPVLIRIAPQDPCECAEPAVQPCTAVLLLGGSVAPEGAPSEASDPEVAPEDGEGETLEEDLLVLTVRGATEGADPRIVLTLWRVQEAAAALGGGRLVQFGDPIEYIPYVQDSSTPIQGGVYRPPERYTLALSVAQLRADGIAIINVQIRDDENLSLGVPIPGPALRDLLGFGFGETGGGPLCAY